MRSLFELVEDWREHWEGMPEFVQEDETPACSLVVNFRSPGAASAFFSLLGCSLDRKESVWWPLTGNRKNSVRSALPVLVGPGRHPVYVVSKGRWESRLTVRALEQLGLPYKIVVEPQERDAYASVIDPGNILTLPFSNLGQGSIPARNWIWEHSLASGADRHWVLDDNINGFYRFNRNVKRRVIDENPFIAAEDFVDRYENVALAGLNYEFLVVRREMKPPFYLNTRIYSCILIKNDLWPEFAWRGRYNEDTDLSLRVLKAGWSTVLFNAFLAKKVWTMTMPGGNTEELYQGNGRWEMAESLRLQHPDCVTVTKKWGRWQHQVDYSRFKRNRLRRRRCLN